MRRFVMMCAVLAALASGVVIGQTQLGSSGSVTVGSGDRRPVDIIADGVPYLRIQPGGQIVLLNGAQFGNAAIGSTTDIDFAAGNFTTNGDKAWTVQSGDVITHYYASIGKMRWYAVDIVTSDIGTGTTGNVMNIIVPFTAKKRVAVPATISNNNVWTGDARCLLPANSNVVGCVLNSAAVFTTGTGTHGIRFQFWAEAS